MTDPHRHQDERGRVPPAATPTGPATNDRVPQSTAQPAGEDLLTVGDVCAWFKVNRDWVYDEVEAGRLPYLRLGRKHLRFQRAELHDYLRSSTRSPPAGPRRAPGGFELEDLDALE